MNTDTRNMHVQISSFEDDVIRVRANPGGRFDRSIPERFGFVESGTPVNPEAADDGVARYRTGTSDSATVVVSGDRITCESRHARVSLTISLERRDRAEDVLEGPCVTISKSEHAFYGLGFQRTSLNLEGHVLDWRRAYRSREATVPFFMSGDGYGFYSNNTWHHRFDFSNADSTVVSAAGGEIDFFLFFGTYADILRSYTALTGRPELLPRWMLGLFFICRYYENQEGVLGIARTFRERKIPCDSIGLEPGWEEVPYRMNWRWSPDRFPDPAAMIEQLHDHEFRFALWESGQAPKRDYVDPEVRRRWYAARVPTSVDIGVDFFKQDDPYPRMLGTDDEAELEMASVIPGLGTVPGAGLSNLANSLYSETAYKEYTRLTGRRSAVMFHSYMASVASHRWGFGWAGDFAAGCGLLSASLSAHSTVSLDMHVNDPGGIHFGFLSAIALIDSWASYREPWHYTEPHEWLIRNYARLRQRLWPYLYSTHRQSAVAGMPMMRPMVLEAPDDPAVRELTGQHMLGEHLLVGYGDASDGKGGSAQGRSGKGDGEKAGPGVPGAPADEADDSARVYLPPGVWIDYWTGERIESSGGWVSRTLPFDVGGPLFAKSGAIVPAAPSAPAVGLDPLELIVVDIYDVADGEFELYEDDGTTPGYLGGEYAVTLIECRKVDRGLELSIGPRTGSYPGMSSRRGFLLRFFCRTVAEQVSIGGMASGRSQAVGDLLPRHDTGWTIDPVEGCLVVKPDSHWSIAGDAPAAARIEADSVRWAGATAASESPPSSSDDRRSVTVVLGDEPISRARHGFGEWSGKGLGTIGGAVSAKPTVKVDAMSGGAPTIPETYTVASVHPAPVELEIALNPPERVALPRGGTWLSYQTTVYGAAMRDGIPDPGVEGPVRLVVEGQDGSELHGETAWMRYGRVVFPSIEYVPVEYRFRLEMGQVVSDSVSVRDIPDVPGVERMDLLAPDG